MFHKSNGEIIDKNKIIQVLGKDFYHDLLEIKDEIKLNRILFGYFNRCFVANQVLSKHNYFLKFFERRDMFRFFIQKKTQGKNEVTRNLSSSVVEKFNGYEMIRQNLARKERVDIIPVDIVYEPTYHENILVPFFFTSEVHLVYKSYVRRFEKGKERICSRVVKQYYYSENVFAKTDESMKKHLSIYEKTSVHLCSKGRNHLCF